MVTPSRILPFSILESLVTCAYKSSGHPLILRAALPGHVHLLCVPLPAGDMFLSVVAVAPGPSLYMWFSMSSALSYMVSRSLQPTPSSGYLGILRSFPDWGEFRFINSTDASSASAPPAEDDLFFPLASGFITMALYSQVMSSLGCLPGVTRLQLGSRFYADDALLLPWERHLLLPMLLALDGLPCSFLRGSCNGHAWAPEMYLELLQLLLVSIAVQLY